MSLQSIKLGNGLFNKERKIADLQEENKNLSSQIENYKQLNLELETKNRKLLNEEFKFKNNYKLLSIELENNQCQNKKYKENQQFLQQQQQQNLQEISDLKKKLLEYQIQISEQDEKIIDLENLKEKFQSDIQLTEQNNVSHEKVILQLKAEAQKQKQNIEILEKQIMQKDKHIAILVKEKERVLKQNDDLLGVSKTNDYKSKQQQNKQKFIHNNKENFSSSIEPNLQQNKLKKTMGLNVQQQQKVKKQSKYSKIDEQLDLYFQSPDTVNDKLEKAVVAINDLKENQEEVEDEQNVQSDCQYAQIQNNQVNYWKQQSEFFEKELKNIQMQNKKLSKENFDLMTRVKNIQK